MKELYKVFYESKNPSVYDNVFKSRTTFESAVHINLSIKPMKQPEIFELYYIPTNEMIDKIGNIYKISRQIGDLSTKLPPVAEEQFIFERLVEELYDTNQLEGVHSTKAEIAKSVREIDLDKADKKRFGSMITSYQGVIAGNFDAPKKLDDIRKIYDEITQGEMAEAELPDGDIFRKDITYVTKKSGTGKVIHRGVTPEAEIHLALSKLLNFMSTDNGIPALIKAAISHYYFGYIHPFYDGNGRTSRFISSLYLSEEIAALPAVSLSQGCYKLRNRYLKAFEITNSVMNRGEMNYFIETFLDIILDALEEMLFELHEKDALLKIAFEKIKHEPKLKHSESGKEKIFMFVLAQNHFFAHHEGVTVKELANVLGLSEFMIRKIGGILLEASLVETKGERPVYYKIKQGYFDEK